jgi:hypothetical protein
MLCRQPGVMTRRLYSSWSVGCSELLPDFCSNRNLTTALLLLRGFCCVGCVLFVSCFRRPFASSHVVQWTRWARRVLWVERAGRRSHAGAHGGHGELADGGPAPCPCCLSLAIIVYLSVDLLRSFLTQERSLVPSSLLPSSLSSCLLPTRPCHLHSSSPLTRSGPTPSAASWRDKRTRARLPRW